MSDNPKRGRGRPRKDPSKELTEHLLSNPDARASFDMGMLHAMFKFTTPYNPSGSGSSERTALKISQRLRGLAGRYAEQGPKAQNLADWIGGIAKCVEEGNSVEAGYCGLMALQELAALAKAEFGPRARAGEEKLAADKRRGHRGKQE